MCIKTLIRFNQKLTLFKTFYKTQPLTVIVHSSYPISTIHQSHLTYITKRTFNVHSKFLIDDHNRFSHNGNVPQPFTSLD